MERLWMRVGVVGPLLGHIAGYAAVLEARGYSERTVDGSVRLVAQLSRWLANQGREAGDLSPVLLEHFLQTRRAAGYRTRSQLAYAPLLNHLGQIGVLSEPCLAGAPTPTDTLLDGYRRYLVRERGLVQTTVRAYIASANRFLAKRLEAGEASLERLIPREVTEAVLAECRRRKPGSAKRWLCELRSLLRFLEIEGRTPTGLLQAVPSVPGWRGASLPRYLTADEVARLLAGCDQGDLVGRRDFAIITLLARLGLRSLEVANLKLDDIDWHRGEIVVQAKGRCERLPLPSDVGQALTSYLYDRPRGSSRTVFLAVLAPIKGLDASGVRCVVRRACRRAGLPPFGAHRLRHTAATQMLNAGASLAEVGQVLRHHDPSDDGDLRQGRSSVAAWPRPTLAGKHSMSRLSAALQDYLAIRRAVGFRLKMAGWVLGRFVAYADQVGAETVTTDLAVAWATQPVDASPVWWKFRLTAVRGFAKHLQTLDPRTQIPPADAVSAPKCRAAPYLYSEAETVQLMEEAANLLPPFRGVTYQTLIGLLAVTGMRLGEAIRLEHADVDWEHAVLTIRLSKFGKSRQIPVDPSTLSALRTYQQARDQLCSRPKATTHLFVSIRGTRLLQPNVDRTFHHLAGRAGLRPRSPRCRPRLHDFRHSFAIRTLLGWYRAGLDVQAMLPRLSTYLGHTNPANTYWYLSAEPELLALAGQRLERAWEVAS